MIIARRGRGAPLWWVVALVCGLLAAFAGWRMIVVGQSSDPPAATLWTPSVQSAAPSMARSAIDGSASDRVQPRWSSRPAAVPVSGSGVVPRRLDIPRLGVAMPIVSSTLDRGQMALPDHPSQIGWYAYGPSPFDAGGAAVLAGHVDSRQYGTGPLAGLRLLRPGDTIVVLGNGKQLTFRVVAVQLVGKQSSALAAAFDRSGPGRLEIITCGGEYLPQQGGYQRNVVVSAVPR